MGRPGRRHRLSSFTYTFLFFQSEVGRYFTDIIHNRLVVLKIVKIIIVGRHNAASEKSCYKVALSYLDLCPVRID